MSVHVCDRNVDMIGKLVNFFMSYGVWGSNPVSIESEVFPTSFIEVTKSPPLSRVGFSLEIEHTPSDRK